MALPSSPPLAPDYASPIVPSCLLSTEHGEDDLPDLPNGLVGHLLPRKRQVSEFDTLSSDPLFSEDVSEADAADYDHSSRRHKRLFRGPWWDQRSDGTSLRRNMAKRERMKNFDSGVWMGSDFSEDSTDAAAEGRETVAEPEEEARSMAATAERLAQAKIYSSLEACQESIDLTDLALVDLSSETLRPLHQLIRNPHTDHARAPTEEEFRPLTPNIQLYLSGNSLRSLPFELFNLTNMTVLSLRNNNLDYIPPAIGRLRHLRELNLAQNNIPSLPWELLDLIQSRSDRLIAILRPNPFLSPTEIVGPCRIPWSEVEPNVFTDGARTSIELRRIACQLLQRRYDQEPFQWSLRDDLEVRLRFGLSQYLEESMDTQPSPTLMGRVPAQSFICLASSPVRLFHADGSPSRPPTQHEAGSDCYAADWTDTDTDTEPIPIGDPGCSMVPSLFELALRTVRGSCAASELRSAPSTFPRSLQSALEAAASSSELGGDSCSSCGRDFIIARAEWMEYWFHATGLKRELSQEAVLPFLRRACSWRCAIPTTPGSHGSGPARDA